MRKLLSDNTEYFYKSIKYFTDCIMYHQIFLLH